MPTRLKVFLTQWLIGTLAVLVATQVVKGIDYDTRSGLLVATLLLVCFAAPAGPWRWLVAVVGGTIALGPVGV